MTGTQAGLMHEHGGHSLFHPSEHYPTWTVRPPTGELKCFLQQSTGWQSVARPADQRLPA